MGFVLAADACIRAPKVPSPIWFRAYDTEGTLSVCIVRSVMLAGLPRRVLVSSESLGIPEPMAAHSIKIPSYTSTVSDITFHLVDDSGDAATLKGTKCLGVEFFSSDGNNVLCKRQAAKSSSMQMSTTIQNEYLRNTRDSDGIYTIQCRADYKDNLGNTIQLEPAVITCEHILSNIITSIDIVLHHNFTFLPKATEVDKEIEEGSKKEIYEISCDSGFPDFALFFLAENGEKDVPPYDSSCISCELKWSDPYEMQRLLFSEMFTKPELYERDDLGEFISYMNTQSYNQLGLYQLSISYQEKSSEALNVLPPKMNKIVIKECSFIMVPGIARELMSFTTIGLVEDAMASNSVLGGRWERSIAEKFLIVGRDAHHHKCTLPSNLSVTVSLRRPEVTEIAEDAPLPRLVGSDANGVLQGKIIHIGDVRGCDFSPLELEPGVGDGDGPIEMVFREYIIDNDDTDNNNDSDDKSGNDDNNSNDNDNDNSSNDNDESTDSNSDVIVASLGTLIQSFQFTSDLALIRKADTLRKTLQPLRDQVKAFDTERKRLNDQITSQENDIIEILRQSESGALKIYIDDIKLLTSEKLNRIKDERLEQTADLERCMTQVRPAKKRDYYPNPNAVAGKQYVGLVCDLGYVDDEATAFILSWVAQHRMDTLLVLESDTANELYEAGVKAWALDQIPKFTVRTKFRSNKDRKRGRLPLEFDKTSVPILGNPRLMVNLIQIHPDQEHLRDTVFYSIFKKSVLMNTLATAMAYRLKLLEENLPLPTIATFDGHRVGTDGVLDPKIGAGRRPASLDFVFGQECPSNSIEFRNVQSDLTTLQQLEPRIRSLDESKSLRRELYEQEDSILTVRASIAHVIDELRAIGMADLDNPVVGNNELNPADKTESLHNSKGRQKSGGDSRRQRPRR